MKPKMFFSLKLAGFAFLMALCPAAWAQSSVVTTTNDSGAGSLRYVISNAVNNAVITFDPSLSGQTIQITNGAILISTNCTIDASALPNGIFLNGNHHAYGIIHIGSGVTASFNYLTFTNGIASFGGAIYSSGNFNVTNCTFANNSVVSNGGPGEGAAIYSLSGNATLINCIFSGNSGLGSGSAGAIYVGGSATMMNCIFSNNNVGSAGGAIVNLGTSILMNCTFSSNNAATGGAIINEGTSMLMNNCTFSGNSAMLRDGGAIANVGGICTLTNCLFSTNASSIGGAIISSSTLNLADCTFSGNFTANGNGGALFVYSSGSVASLLNCTITGNSVTNSSGAGIYNQGTLALTNCIVAGNAPDNISGSFTGINNLTNGNPMLSALGNYGGPVQTMLPLPGSPALDAGNDAAVAGLATDARGYPRISGAHVDIGAAEFQNPIVTTTADSGAGSLRTAVGNVDAGGSITFAPNLSGQTILLTSGQINLVTNCTVDASALPNGISLNGNNASTIFNIGGGVTAAFNYLTFTNGRASNGGAIYNNTGILNFTNCTFVNNLAFGGNGDDGGAIFSQNGTMILVNCMFSTNSAGNYGGAIYGSGGNVTLMNCTFSTNNAAAFGGAVCNFHGTFMVLNCTFTKNIAKQYLGGAIANLSGIDTLVNCVFSANTANTAAGAIYVGDTYQGTSGILNLTNCSFVGNFCTSGGVGGALFLDSGAVASLLNCTITGNSVTNGSGAGIYNSAGTLALTNCIVAGNAPDNINGSFTGINNLTNGNPMLSPLGNYGGSVQTMLPLPGSPALDAGNDAAVAGLATDARGYPRISGAHVDIGAAELQTAIVTTTADSGPGSLRAAASGYVDAGASITFAPNLSGQTITLTSGQITLVGGSFVDPDSDGNIEYGALNIDASALPGGITISGNHASGIFYIPIDGIIFLKSLALINGNAYHGGAIDVESGELTLANCSLIGNSASVGGAIYSDSGGQVVVNQSTLSGNSAPNGGGAIANVFKTMSLNECTLSGNAGAGGGGAILNEYDSETTVNECTLWGNSAANGKGGAIYNGLSFNNESVLSMNQCTVSGNSANNSGGGIFNDDNDGEVTSLNNSIVSGNTGVDFYGTYNGAANLVGGNAKLAALGNYGGPTQTMPPLPGSPAIDGCTSGTSFATDQRGYPRTLGFAPDLGAVEGIFVTNLPGKLTGMTRLGNGSTQFTFTNLSDASSTVLASTNLTLPVSAWPTAGNAIETPAGSGQFQFTDPQATNYPQRFYRVRLP
jgi:parallel beta helix pectate lyase-like protein